MLETLCVIDDDPVFTFLLKKMIEKAEVIQNTLFFENGQEAIEYLTQNKDEKNNLPQVILLDINMPILDGWQFLAQYAALKPLLSRGISIFMTSSSTETEDYERAMSSGHISDYIHKPIYAPELKEIVKRALEAA